VKAATPIIKAIKPMLGKAGSRVKAYIYGANLQNVKVVEFKGSSIKVKILSGGTSTKLPIIIGIHLAATRGELPFRVVTSSGSAWSPSGVVFIVR
jgi:hypothetical protein